MTIKSIIKNQILLLTILVLTSFSLISCSNETEDFTQNESSTELNNPVFLAKGGPVSLFSNYTCESDIMGISGGCYTFQIRFYVTISGTTYLTHSAIMSTGDCNQRRVNEPCDGNYKGDFIVKDDRVNGCIRDFLDSDSNFYDMYARVKEQIIENY